MRDLGRAVPGSCGNFREENQKYFEKSEKKISENLKFLEKNGILKFIIFLFFIKNCLEFFIGEFCVLRAIFCDSRTPLGVIIKWISY